MEQELNVAPRMRNDALNGSRVLIAPKLVDKRCCAKARVDSLMVRTRSNRWKIECGVREGSLTS